MSETTAPERETPVVEYVPFPEAALSTPAPPTRAGPLGALPLDDDPPPPVPWLVPAVIVVVLAVAVIAVIAVLTGGDDRATRPARPINGGESVLGPPLGADLPTTAVPTTAVPTTAVPTTAAAAATTSLPALTPAGGWIAFTSAEPPFQVELPAQPEESQESVMVDGTVRTRVERVVVLGGGTLGIGSVRWDPGADPDQFLLGIAQAAARQLKGRLEVGAAGTMGRGRALEFTVVLRDGGRFRGAAITANGVLHVLSASGPEASVRPAYFRMRSSFEPG